MAAAPEPARHAPAGCVPGDRSDEEDEPVSACDFHRETSELAAERRAEIASISKRLKLAQDQYVRVSAAHRQVNSEASTASSTPTHSSMVAMSPSSPSLEVFPSRSDVDYRKLSEAELREELGDLGTSFTSSWDREELIGVLEQMDRRIAGLEL